MNTRQWIALPQTRKDAWWLWTGLQSEIHHLCAWLEDPELFVCSLPRLEPGDVISLAQPWYERLMLSYRAAERDYLMNVIFDPDLLSVRFAIDNEPRGHELLIVRRRRKSVLIDEDGILLTEEEAAEHIVRSLLVGWWPASCDTAAAA